MRPHANGQRTPSPPKIAEESSPGRVRPKAESNAGKRRARRLLAPAPNRSSTIWLAPPSVLPSSLSWVPAFFRDSDLGGPIWQQLDPRARTARLEFGKEHCVKTEVRIEYCVV